MAQESFSPLKYGFKWVRDWYSFNREHGVEMAKFERDQRARELKKQGKKVRKFTLRHQMVRRGGIGTGHPEIDLCVNVYCLQIG